MTFSADFAATFDLRNLPRYAPRGVPLRGRRARFRGWLELPARLNA